MGVVAVGLPAPSFQWQLNGSNIAGATGASLTLTNVQPNAAGVYTVVAANASGLATSRPVNLTVTIAPTITTQPVSQTVVAGGTASFTVVATGSPAPTYQWQFQGASLTVATSATLTLTNVQTANAGSYDVVVSSAAGHTTSNVAVLTVGTPVTITEQPVSVSVPVGGSASFTMGASGTGLTYQWSFNGTGLTDGNGISGSTTATLMLANVQAANAGTYAATVTSSGVNTTSSPATLALLTGNSAAHAVNGSGFGYVAGQTVTITNTISYTGTATSLGWSVLLPNGWSFASSGGNAGDVGPTAGDSSELDWAWTNPPSSPVTFTYTLNVPAGSSGPQTVTALVILRLGGSPVETLAQPDPLVVPQLLYYAADENRDGKISLLELTRVIELYNTHYGTTRTGAYTDHTGTEDGFAPDTTRSTSQTVSLSQYHSADENQDGKISLLELTRLIELYNYHNGTTRTGQYHAQAGTEDGFASGP